MHDPSPEICVLGGGAVTWKEVTWDRKPSFLTQRKFEFTSSRQPNITANSATEHQPAAHLESMLQHMLSYTIQHILLNHVLVTIWNSRYDTVRLHTEMQPPRIYFVAACPPAQTTTFVTSSNYLAPRIRVLFRISGALLCNCKQAQEHVRRAQ